MAISRSALLALAASLASLGAVIEAGTVAPATGSSDVCAAASSASGTDAAEQAAAPAPRGTLPGEAVPAAVITISGRDAASATPAGCPAPDQGAASVKAPKTRSNIQNNRAVQAACTPAPGTVCPQPSPAQAVVKSKSNITNN